MGHQSNQGDGISLPSFGLSETDVTQLPIPHDTGLFQLVVPMNGLDMEFIWKISQLLEISLELQDLAEMSTLNYVVQEAFRQMFANFDRSPAVYLQMVNGSAYDPGVPGVPVEFHFKHIAGLNDPAKFAEFRTIVRYFAVEMYNQVLAWANLPPYSNCNFTYRYYPLSGGGLIFVLEYQRTIYDI